MAQTRERSGARYDEQAGVGAGWILFAAIMMITGGCFAILEGLAALLKRGRFHHDAVNYPYGAHVTGWGWIILISGVIVLLAGFSVMAGALWARIVGITIASLIAVAAVVEVAFSLNGLGAYLVQAAQSKDLAVVQGISLVLVTAFVVVNLLVDVLYAVLDPRVRAS